MKASLRDWLVLYVVLLFFAVLLVYNILDLLFS